MIDLFIHNTLGKKREKFEPIEAGKVSFYLCGPTVYDLPHLGHGRSAVCFDVMRRFFKLVGYEVNFVSNYTDIDDKMITRALEESLSVPALAAKIIPEYEKDYGDLNILPADVRPLATEHIEEIIFLIKELEAKGYTYLTDDGVYYDISKFAAYGELSGQNLDELRAGARVAMNDGKRSAGDFVLWKFKKEGEPAWESPWGEGRPGWHIECSAMTYKHLGEKFDIHAGGQDLMFPHHECEVAQSQGVFGEGSFAKYWIHNGFITIDNEKMSKSLGNFFTLRDIYKSFSPMAVRLMFLQTHYRNPINFSQVLLEQSTNSLSRVYDFVRALKRVAAEDLAGDAQEVEGLVSQAKSDFLSSLSNDFDTSGAMGALFELIKASNSLIAGGLLSSKGAEALIEVLGYMDNVFAFIFSEKIDELSQEESDLFEARNKARSERDFALSDKLRANLLKLGVVVEDLPTGTVWKRSV